MGICCAVSGGISSLALSDCQRLQKFLNVSLSPTTALWFTHVSVCNCKMRGISEDRPEALHLAWDELQADRFLLARRAQPPFLIVCSVKNFFLLNLDILEEIQLALGGRHGSERMKCCDVGDRAHHLEPKPTRYSVAYTQPWPPYCSLPFPHGLHLWVCVTFFIYSWFLQLMPLLSSWLARPNSHTLLSSHLLCTSWAISALPGFHSPLRWFSHSSSGCYL